MINVRFEDLVGDEPVGSRFPWDDKPMSGWTLIDDFWREGISIYRELLSSQYIDRYCDLFRRTYPHSVSGWPAGTPYMQHPEILDICCNPDVTAVLTSLFDGRPVGLHLNLTGWVSTERNWHQDCYLSPPAVGSHYVAAWFALEDINPDSGPFEYAVGSHELPPMSIDRVMARLSPEERANPNWPKTTESWVVAACEAEIAKHGYPVRQFLGKRGDVLFWHSRLLHRGSPPRVFGTSRKALIAHYSVLDHRSKIDMPNYARHGDGGYYFIL